MINYIITDDEPQARKLLAAYMDPLPNYHLVKHCANAMEAYEVLSTQPVDFMFLDIRMPMVSGIDFLRSLKNPPLVVLTTAFNKYALEGYDLHVVDYLLKPISLPRLLTALEKVNERLNKTRPDSQLTGNHLFIKSDHKLVKVEFAEILLVESLQNFVKLHLADKVVMTNSTMKELEGKLPPQQFLRVHRSYLVPVREITAINGNMIETRYRNIPIGVSYKNEVMRYVRGEQGEG